jgi:hypothetical protein
MCDEEWPWPVREDAAGYGALEPALEEGEESESESESESE